MWRCLLVSSNMIQMESSKFFVSRKLFMVCIKVLVPSENTSLKNWVTLAYLKLHFSLAPFGKELLKCYIDDLI